MVYVFNFMDVSITIRFDTTLRADCFITKRTLRLNNHVLLMF